MIISNSYKTETAGSDDNQAALATRQGNKDKSRRHNKNDVYTRNEKMCKIYTISLTDDNTLLLAMPPIMLSCMCSTKHKFFSILASDVTTTPAYLFTKLNNLIDLSCMAYEYSSHGDWSMI